VNSVLKTEAGNIDQWRDGDSYNALSELLVDIDNDRALLAELARTAMEAGANINAISAGKKNFELALSKCFK
jgi:hypothetical protein